MTALANIRNFAIIAHIDHGKSTLADRLIQHCGGLSEREMRAQVLDSMEIERERGITIKAQTVRLCYRARDGLDYVLNLMDTPGHVDFSYEVSRSLAACEGSLLLVDASQGVEAQTVANTYLAIEHDHEIIPVLNKVDLASAQPELVRQQIEEITGLDARGAVEISAKDGSNIPALLEGIVQHLPAPQGKIDGLLKALLIDSWYDPYLGVVILTRVIDGQLRSGLRIRLMATGGARSIEKLGIFSPKPVQVVQLDPGEIGFVITGLKDINEAKVGDTITSDQAPVTEALSGFKPSVPVVFCGIFPNDQDHFEHLRESLGKLSLNDASFHFEPQSSPALGFGFRCGFLGLLHLEIVQERLEREFNLELVTTAPSVVYRVHLTDGSLFEMHNPSDMPDASRISFVEEPWIKAMILLPLNEVVFDFHDRIKSLSQGYASLDYQPSYYRKGPLVTMHILVNGVAVDALSMVVHAIQAEARGRALCVRLKELIPRQLFKIAIQAAIGGRILARETIGSMRKDVTAKCYGGDITRKRKLWDKQKKGKKRMRQFGHVEIPHSALLETLKMGSK